MVEIVTESKKEQYMLPSLYCLSIHSLIDPLVHSSIHRSIHTSIHSSIGPFIHPYIHPSIYLSIHTSIHSSIYPSIHSFIHLSIHPYIHQSIYSSIHTFTTLVLFYAFQYLFLSPFDVGQTPFGCLEGRGRSQRKRCMLLDVITIYVVQLSCLCTAAVIKDIKILYIFVFVVTN